MRAAAGGGLRAVTVLVEAGVPIMVADTNKQGEGLLHAAAAGRESGVVRLLLSKGFPVDGNPAGLPATPLILAAKNSVLDIGLTIDKTYDSIFMRRLLPDDRAYRNLILSEPGSADRAWRRMAPREREARLATLQVLLAAGADANALAEGSSALHYAADHGDVASVEALLRAKARPDEVNSKGFTPLMIAAYEGYREVVKALIVGGAQVDKQDGEGQTALMRAAIAGGDAGTVRALVTAGADVNLRNAEGQTALMYAVGGRPDSTYERADVNPNVREVVTILLSAGADPLAKDAKGASATRLAKVSRYRAALEPINDALRARRGS
jgi:ankyrin repeat protein